MERNFLLVLSQFLLCLVAADFLRSNQATPQLTCAKKTLEPAVTDKEIEEASVLVPMQDEEKILLWREMKKASSFFEYGSGGTTELACQAENLQHIVSVDGTREFLDALMYKSSCLQKSTKWTPYYVDIGQSREFGYPIEHKPIQWANYTESVAKFQHLKPDLVLIDGRFRTTSALHTLLSSDPNTRIAIHDFYTRNSYLVLLDFTDIVDCIGNLVILQKKPDAKHEEILRQLSNIMFNTWPKTDTEEVKKNLFDIISKYQIFRDRV